VYVPGAVTFIEGVVAVVDHRYVFAAPFEVAVSVVEEFSHRNKFPVICTFGFVSCVILTEATGLVQMPLVLVRV
jgi:hypothetical protein